MSQGITALLDAEKEAQKIVQKARDYRTARVKEARSEAAKEIEAYKKSKDEEFSANEKEHSGDSSNLQSELDENTQKQIDALKSSFGQNKEKVIQELLEKVVEINPELHRNYKSQQTKTVQ